MAWIEPQGINKVKTPDTTEYLPGWGWLHKFTPEQEAMIRQMFEDDKIAEAQKLILDNLQKPEDENS